MFPRKLQYNRRNQKGDHPAGLSMLFLSPEGESRSPKVTRGPARAQSSTSLPGSLFSASLSPPISTEAKETSSN